MKTKAWKKIQRCVNSIIRNLNEGIKEDGVLKGRFSVKQVDRKTFSYHSPDDGSEFELLFFVQLKDNETGLTKTVTIKLLSFTIHCREFAAAQLLAALNKFIIYDCYFEEE